MSCVTSVYIVTGYATPEFERAVTAEGDFGHGGALLTAFASLDTDAAGGTKHPGGNVYAAGLNYADTDAIGAWLDALPWSDFGMASISTEGGYDEVRIYTPGKPPVVHVIEYPDEGWMGR